MCFRFILNIFLDLPDIREAAAPKTPAVTQISFLGITRATAAKNFTRGRRSECLNRRKGRRDAIIGLFHTCLEGIVKVENTYRNSILIDNHKGGYSEFFHSGNCKGGEFLFGTG